MSHIIKSYFNIEVLLEGTACYAGFLLAPAESFGPRPELFYPLGKKKLFMLILFIFGVQ